MSLGKSRTFQVLQTELIWKEALSWIVELWILIQFFLFVNFHTQNVRNFYMSINFDFYRTINASIYAARGPEHIFATSKEGKSRLE